MNGSSDKIRLGTRGSALALWQARAVEAMLGRDCTVVVIETSGDRLLHVPLQGRPEKGFFTKEIEEHLLAGTIDAAVHSLKDMPTHNPDGLVVAACLERASTADLLLIRPDSHQPDRPIPVRPGCRVGASSLRRQSLLACYAPDCSSAFLRGNVPTRIRKCLGGQYGAIIVARAGIDRLQPDLGDLLVYELDPCYWLPAPGQGAVAVQARTDAASLMARLQQDNVDTHHKSAVDSHSQIHKVGVQFHPIGNEDMRSAAILARLQRLDHVDTHLAVTIERNLLAHFEGGCHTAFGAWARRADEDWDVRVGMDRPGLGWHQTHWVGSFDACMSRAPAGIIPLLRKPEVPAEGLCRRVR